MKKNITKHQCQIQAGDFLGVLLFYRGIGGGFPNG